MEVRRRLEIGKNERGIAIVYLALIIVFLIFMAAIVIDLGYMYVTKAQLQNAADAGALAGDGVLRPNVFSSISSAKNTAKKFAETNSAAGISLQTGVSLDKSQNEITSTNDITVGYWDGTTYHDGPSYITNSPPNPLNAVKVRVRRTTGSNLGPVSLFFARVFNWTSMGAGAEAIADQEPAKLLPIIVNEYWMSEDKGNRPYGNNQEYPNSFVRVTNVDGSASKVFGKIFAIMGGNANDNVPSNEAKGASNVNGFVYLDERNSCHDPAAGTWYVLNNGASTSPDCANCPSYFTQTVPTTGTIASEKFNASIGYLFNGYLFMPPATVNEPARSTPYKDHYPKDSVYATPTSSCPYATIAYFPMSGNQPLNKTGPTGLYFNEAFTPGKKIITLVYDGTFRPQSILPGGGTSQPNAVTAVGYVLLQIDGYSSTEPKQLNLNTNPTFTAKGNKSEDGNTLYGHAVSNIITPGPCNSDIINQIQALQYMGASPRLVK